MSSAPVESETRDIESRTTYTAYGLTIESEIVCPELPPAVGAPDVQIRVVAAPDRERPESDQTVQVSVASTILYFGAVGWIHVEHGEQIRVEALPDASIDTVRSAVLGVGLAVALHQRGILALHGSAVAIDGRAAIFLGASGQGKSTMAALLRDRGCPLVTDDVAAIEWRDGAYLRPGFPQLKMWPNSLDLVEVAPDGLPKVEPGYEKRLWRIESLASGEPLPIAAIYLLDVDDTPSILPLNRQDALTTLIGQSFCARRLEELGNVWHFSECARLARTVPVFVVSRPRDLTVAGSVADQVITHARSLAG